MTQNYLAKIENLSYVNLLKNNRVKTRWGLPVKIRIMLADLEIPFLLIRILIGPSYFSAYIYKKKHNFY